MTRKSWSPIKAMVRLKNEKKKGIHGFAINFAPSWLQTPLANSFSPAVLSHIISQLRPGADLSRVVLPTFILEPRSMLERITKLVA